MKTITLPPAASRSPYDHLTIRNTSTEEELTIIADGTDTIDIYDVASIVIGIQNARTFQSNGVDAWFVIQGFSPPTQRYEGPLTTDYIATTTPTVLAGTPVALIAPGLYIWNFETEITVVGVPGNQTWSLIIELYLETANLVLGSTTWAGEGEPLANPRNNITDVVKVDETAVNDTLAIRAYRLNATGTVTMLGDGTLSSLTIQKLTGPL